MGSLTTFSVLTFIVATVLIYSQAAPVTEYFGPPQTIEGDSNVIYPNPERVEEMERFHRTNKDGSVEFKTALSNGHVQYQKISTKFIDGKKVQVYKGYISERYNDGSYGTRYYAADENGYRTTDVLVDDKPPILPSSGSFAVNGPRGISMESASVNDEAIQNKTKSMKDELVKIQHDLEDEQLSSLNLGSSSESGLKKFEDQDASGDQTTSNVGGIQTDLPLKSDVTSSTELPLISDSEVNNGKVRDEPESSTLPASEETSSTAATVESSTIKHNEEQSSTEKNTGNLGEQSSDPLTTPDSLLEVSTDQSLPEVSDEGNSSSSKDDIPPATTETLLNYEESTTEHQYQETSTEVQEILRTDDGTSRVSTYPLENAAPDSTTLASVDGVSTNSDEDEVTNSSTVQPILGDIENKSTLPIDSETETNFETSTSSFTPAIDNEITLTTEKSKENEIESEVSTELPSDLTTESHEVATDTPIILENSSIDNKEGKSLEVSTDSPLSEDTSSISIVEGSGNSSSEEDFSEISETTTSGTIEESTNIIDKSTEQPKEFSTEDSLTTLAPESHESQTTGVKTDSDSSTEQPTALIGSEEVSNENSGEKLINNDSSTELRDESSEVILRTTTEAINETTLEEEVLTTTQANEESVHGVGTQEKSSDESDKESHEASSEVSNNSEDSSDSNKEARSLNASTESPLSEDSNSTNIVKENLNNSEKNVSESGNAIETSTDKTENVSDDSIISTTVSPNEESDSSTVIDKDSDSSTEQPTAEERLIQNQSSTELPSEESSEESARTTEAIEETTTEADADVVLSTTQESEEKTHGAGLEYYPPVIHF